jgi:uncharacterized protein YndB with AHSA1/START domain
MNKITIKTAVNAPITKIWEYWSRPEHITNWAFASDDWEAPEAENDLREGGKFKTRMQAKDGSMGFDFTGVYTSVKKHALIEYNMDKAASETVSRHVKIEFKEAPESVGITITFDAEKENPIKMQREGWQAILDNFKKYVENS